MSREGGGQRSEGGVQLGFEPAQTGVHGDVDRRRQGRRPKEGLGPSVLQGLAYGEITGEEGVDLWRRLAYARLDIKNGYSRQPWLWQTTSPENLDG